MDEYKKQFEEYVRGNRISRSGNSFKIKLFLKKGPIICFSMCGMAMKCLD